MTKKQRIVIIPIATIVAIGLLCATTGWDVMLGENMRSGEKGEVRVERGWKISDVVERMERDGMVESGWKLRMAAKVMGIGQDREMPKGCYAVEDGMGNWKLLRRMTRHQQKPVRLVVNGVRLPEDLAQKISKQMELDSTEFMTMANDSVRMGELGYKTGELFVMFVANTYEVYWDETAESLFARMAKESEKFWTEDRQKKAEAIGLSRGDVVTLASIVEEESKYAPELRRIAGLYINRLRRGIPLQSDPTVKFAVGDFGLKQIYFKHLQTESPYNTYLHTGLPPTPIRLPQIAAIDAVLDAEKHEYYYMCADAALDGTHRFARTLEEHNRNAARYHTALRRWLKEKK